jgi:hypothetical protein
MLVVFNLRVVGAIAAIEYDCASELWNLEDKKPWFEELYEVQLEAHRNE